MLGNMAVNFEDQEWGSQEHLGLQNKNLGGLVLKEVLDPKPLSGDVSTSPGGTTSQKPGSDISKAISRDQIR